MVVRILGNHLELTVMGRGLSDLQKVILRRAAQQRSVRELQRPRLGGRCAPPARPDAFYFELLADAFGWKPKSWGNFGGRHFSRAALGDHRYRAALASLSRACARLEARGLLQRVQVLQWGVLLTDKGAVVAAHLVAADSGIAARRASSTNRRKR